MLEVLPLVLLRQWNIIQISQHISLITASYIAVNNYIKSTTILYFHVFFFLVQHI